MDYDTRPSFYRYYDQLMDHLGGDESVFFNGELIYPRQFEIHLPGNHITHCNCDCKHCQGGRFKKDLGRWELDALELLNKLEGKIPYHIYGGAYTEPLLNPYFMTFLATTKRYGNHFGIHTNGTLLNQLEEKQGWLTELNKLSTDKTDYLSVSIDGGTARSWSRTKRAPGELFFEIIEGIKKACKVREENHNIGHAIRMCYLISPENGTYEDFAFITTVAKEMGIDSLRFSIPYAQYNQSFDAVREYRKEVELPNEIRYKEMLWSFLSKDSNETPYIFYTGAQLNNIYNYVFDKCVYFAYQITYGADGFVYKCSAVAAPSAKQCRLGKVTSDVKEFETMLMKNADYNWSCQDMCFNKGIRCNRQGLEINRKYHERSARNDNCS